MVEYLTSERMELLSKDVCEDCLNVIDLYSGPSHHCHKSRDFQARLDSARIDTLLTKPKFGLLPFQRAGAEWLASHPIGMLADDHGLGKTIQALLALPTDTSTLVLCPNVSTVMWRNAARRYQPMSVRLAMISSFERWPKDSEIMIMSYDVLSRHKIDLPVPNDMMLIADECQHLKNPNTKRTSRARSIINNIKARGRVWLLCSGARFKTSIPFETLGLEAYKNNILRRTKESVAMERLPIVS